MATISAASPELSRELPVLVLTDAVMFPGTVTQLEVKSPSATALAEYLDSHRDVVVALFTARRASVTEPASDDLYPVGTLCTVVGAGRKDSAAMFVLQGLSRAHLDDVTEKAPFVRARVHSTPDEPQGDDTELEALGLALKEAVRQVVQLLHLPSEIAAQLDAVSNPGVLADIVASRLDASLSDKAELLATLGVKARVRAVLGHVARRVEVLKTRQAIDAQVKDEMGRKQREHFLREQMKAIEKELADDDDDEALDDLDALEKRVVEARLSEEARTVATKQMKRLRAMQGGSPEYAAVRNYVEWIIDLPWAPAEAAPDPDIGAVRAVLEADHHGLERVKKRIVEYLAVRKLKSDKHGPILCLIGPPGVGKTSLGKSVARALGRKFHRISLGGVHDEAAIRGHRRTYVGALPGNIIQGLKKVGAADPVLMLDEIDKLGRDPRAGDPASALLEVLDPEQNDTFTDHYLEIPYDLSNVFFIATANVVDTIPAPLRDRMEIIEIPGYTRYEKLAIARRHLVPKQLAEHGLTPDTLQIEDEALQAIIERYTREAGVRSLEKRIAAVVRAAAVRFAEGDDRSVLVGAEDLKAFLGPAPHDDELAERTSEPGVATGLAWTPVGGRILFVEATRMPGKGSLTLTGQLGDVMKESAWAALSYVRANSQRWGIPRDFLDKSDIHIHVPSGALPKDGPSAGITMLTALVSLLSGVRARPDIAMTGEITLRGRVLPIGGLKEKVLAAHRAGIKRVIVPERNRADLEEIPKEVKSEIEFVFVSQMAQAVEAALEEAPWHLPAVTPAAASFSL